MQILPLSLAWVRCFVLGMFLLSLAAASIEAADLSDHCSGAVVIPSAGPFPHLTRDVDMSLATIENDPPFPPAAASFDELITHSVWFKFTPQASGLYTISSGPDTGTQIRDSTMIMYTATGDCGPFTIHSYNEDSGTLRAAISTTLVAGTNYYIVVWVGRLSHPDTTTNEPLDLQLNISKPSVPANNTCATAFELPSVISTMYTLPEAIDTTLATTTAGITPPCVTNIGAFPSRDVWFKFTPAASGTYIFSTSSTVGTLVVDTAMGLYTMPNGCSSPNQIACNDNGLGRAVLYQSLNAGTTYYLAVWDNAPNYIPGETRLQLSVSQGSKPTVETLAPISLASTGVVLSGSVNVNALVGRFWFEWGATSSLGSTSQVKVLFANATTFTTNLTVSGFSPNIVYQYRMVSTNTQGRSEGAIKTFVWKNSSPTLSSPHFPDNSGGQAFEFSFTGHTNQVYVIQASTNLIHWTDLGTTTNRETSQFNFRHSLPPVSPQFYYQIRLP